MKKLAEESEKVLNLSKKDRDTFTKKIESLELELQEAKERLQGDARDQEDKLRLAMEQVEEKNQEIARSKEETSRLVEETEKVLSLSKKDKEKIEQYVKNISLVSLFRKAYRGHVTRTQHVTGTQHRTQVRKRTREEESRN